MSDDLAFSNAAVKTSHIVIASSGCAKRKRTDKGRYTAHAPTRFAYPFQKRQQWLAVWIHF